MERILRIRQSDRQVFNDLLSGLKSLETRAAAAKYRNLSAGDTLTFACGGERLSKTIRKAYYWPSVDAMAKAVDWKQVMPHAASLAEVKSIYASYPGYAEKIRAYGLVGFELC